MSLTLKVLKHFLSVLGLFGVSVFPIISALNAPHYFLALYKWFITMLNIGLRLSLFKSFSISLLNESPPKDHDVDIHFVPQMQFMLLFSRQGKLRLQKWYVPLSDKERKKISRDLVQTILARKPKMCSFLEWRDLKIVYKRYSNLTAPPIFHRRG